MNRRKFLIGAGSLAAGSAAAMGTGAFTSVEAERSVSVDLEGDASAYLGLSGDGYVVNDNESGTSKLSIALGAAATGEGGQGFNKNARTVIQAVDITNQGTSTVSVSVDDSDLVDGVAAEYVGDANVTPGETETRAIEFTVNDRDYDVSGDVGTLTITAMQ